MAKTVQTTNDDAKAKARHEKIAREKRDAEVRAKEKISDDKWKAIRAEEKRKEEIKKLPKEERAAARKELKEQIRHRKAVEKEQKRARKEAEKAKREAARKEAQAKAAGAAAHQQAQVEETVAPTEHEEGVPGELPADTVETPEDSGETSRKE